MVPLNRAIEIILSATTQGQVEGISIDEALGRVLSEPFLARTDLPPFTTSSVDGFAVKLPCSDELQIIGEVPAGRAKYMTIGHQEAAVEVFTGSLIPSDTDAVVMVEDVQRSGSTIRLLNSPAFEDNLRRQGKELAAGSSLLGRGALITPPVLALLSSAGQFDCSVFKRPRVTVIETGNELRSPGEILEPGEIYAANGLALASAAESLGAVAHRHRCPDDPNLIRQVFSRALKESDLIITSGGVSVGKHDHVRAIWASLGAEERFWRVAIRPGRPLFFATVPGGPMIFGLPGNPVSSLVTFHLAIRPALLKLYGRDRAEWLKARTSFSVNSSETVEIFERVRLEDGVAYPIREQGSHMGSGLAKANALLRIPQGVGELPIGATLPVLPLDWSSV